MVIYLFIITRAQSIYSDVMSGIVLVLLYTLVLNHHLFIYLDINVVLMDTRTSLILLFFLKQQVQCRWFLLHEEQAGNSDRHVSWSIQGSLDTQVQCLTKNT